MKDKFINVNNIQHTKSCKDNSNELPHLVDPLQDGADRNKDAGNINNASLEVKDGM